MTIIVKLTKPDGTTETKSGFSSVQEAAYWVEQNRRGQWETMEIKGKEEEKNVSVPTD